LIIYNLAAVLKNGWEINGLDDKFELAGWHTRRYGIPPDIVAQCDRVTLWTLACTVEALTMSGIMDLYKLYKHMHLSEMGTCISNGMGGMESLQFIFRDGQEENEVQNDIL
jgi:fatty acid synthase subunit alpha, fungi type